VSWPLISTLAVLAVLATGWLAYERSRPSARMVAVVATLAALAALGRDAFVALPEVKPITAMTLVVGYALGPLPGFTVGAIGMLASNIMLGQGPYTPWQMAAWGLVGLAGAALGVLSGRRLGRVPLALACAVAALGAKEIMNLYTWTLGASHTPAALLATAGAALPFDLVDAGASLIFGLIFAPELARMLARMRTRMDISWQAAGASVVVLVALVVCAGATIPSGGTGHAMVAIASRGTAQVTTSRAPGPGTSMRAAGGMGGGPRAAVAASEASVARAQIARELAFLAGAQNADGGFGGARGRSSSELYTAWAAMGLAAGGRDVLGVVRGGHTPADALRREAATLEGPGDLERTILALHACGLPPGTLGARNLLAELLRARTSDGSFEHLVNITTFAVFALRAVGRPASDPIVRAAGRWLTRQQNADGGFGFAARGGASDVDDTAAAIQGIVDAGLGAGGAASRAAGFLVGAQNPDGGFPQERGNASNAQSSAWAIQGLLAAGRNVGSIRRGGSRSPLGYLESLVAPDGSVRYSRTSAQTPVWVTAQALTALAGKTFPIAPVRRGASHRVARAGVAADPHASRRTADPKAAIDARAGVPAGAGSRAIESRLNGAARRAGALVGIVLAPMLASGSA
jgi:energy-coupling factor transport system substrate-specific component